MRVASRGNLTVELIRQYRFDVGVRHTELSPVDRIADRCHDRVNEADAGRCPIDRVQLGQPALPSDPWAEAVGKARPQAGSALLDLHTAQPHVIEHTPEPDRLTPVLGSPALGGLGTAWIVPGTLLDVVA